jgi:hypothetical protein
MATQRKRSSPDAAHRGSLELTLQRFERYQIVEYTSIQQGLPDARHARLFTRAADGFDYDRNEPRD